MQPSRRTEHGQNTKLHTENNSIGKQRAEMDKSYEQLKCAVRWLAHSKESKMRNNEMHFPFIFESFVLCACAPNMSTLKQRERDRGGGSHTDYMRSLFARLSITMF